jgi:hypothetical protein
MRRTTDKNQEEKGSKRKQTLELKVEKESRETET